MKSEGGTSAMYDKVRDHEERIILLEEADKKHEERLVAIESNYKDLENTIWKTSQSTQEVFRDTINKQWELINTREQMKESKSQRDYDLQKTKTTKMTEVIVVVAGSGGIIMVLAQLIFGS